MKKYVLGLCLLSASLLAAGQDPTMEFDLTTNNITAKDEVKTESLARYVKSIMNIEAGNESGQGLMIAPDLMIASYSLIAGKSDVTYADETGKRKYFDGYIAADPARGIVLLKTADLQSSYIAPSYTAYNAFLGTYEKTVISMKRSNNKYILNKVTIPGIQEIKGAWINQSYIPRKVQYQGNKPEQGEMIFSNNMFYGIIVYIDGEPFHINNRPLMELYLFKDLAPNHLSDLRPYYAGSEAGKKSKPVIYKIGLTDEKKTRDGKKTYDILTLDYARRDKQRMDLYFSFKSLGWSSGINFNPNLRMIDLKTGIIYHPTEYGVSLNKVYNNTTERKIISFENVPEYVDQVKLFNLYTDVYEQEKDLRYNSEFKSRRFFDNVIFNNFPVTKKTDYELDEDLTNEGTVAFYGLSSSNFDDNVRILIDGKQVGVLTHYITNTYTTDFCGLKSSITMKLKPGEYKYKAIMGRKTIERKFMVTKGKCTGQLVKF